MYSQKKFNMPTNMIDTRKQTRYPVSSPAVNDVRSDGVNASMTRSRKCAVFLLSTRIPTPCKQTQRRNSIGMSSGLLASHSADPPLPTPLPGRCRCSHSYADAAMDRNIILLEPNLEIPICVQQIGKCFLVDHRQVDVSCDIWHNL